MLTLALAASFLWSAAIITQNVSIALIAAISSIVNTLLVVRVKTRVESNTEKLESRRIVVTRTDKGILITDEDVRELEDRA